MKSLKKILAVLVATAMVAGMGVMAFGAGPRSKDSKIEITGLTSGDEVRFYRVLVWNQNASGTGGWVAANDFSGTVDTAMIQNMLKYRPSGNTFIRSGTGITEDIAGQIGAIAKTLNPDYTVTAAGSPASAKVESGSTDPVAGLYVVLINPYDKKVMYNPIFVGADYDPSGSGNTWTVNLNDSYQPATMPKKGEITLDKSGSTSGTRADNLYNSGTQISDTVAVGDWIVFTVQTTIPEYGNDYTNPRFIVTDVLSEGLKLDSGTIIVSVSGTTATPGTEYTLKDVTENGYTVDFSGTVIKGYSSAMPVVITYKAQLDPSGTESVNMQDNTVTVDFSNYPTDTSGSGKLKDKTNHYYFDIDGDIWGDEEYETSELIKVGLDDEGNEIKERINLDNSGTAGALQDAHFKLTTDEAGNNTYSNGTSTDFGDLVSTSTGKIVMQGLDAGTYYLKETIAPAGYVIDPHTYKIEIIPTFQEVTVTEGSGTNAISYKLNILKSYQIKVDGRETANYTVESSGTTGATSNGGTVISAVNHGDKVGKSGTISGTDTSDADSRLGKIQNTQGTALPSTGGIGTTLFYAGGALLVLMAGILLVSKRRVA